MNEQVEQYIKKYPSEITGMFYHLRQIVFDSVSAEPKETIWAGMPSYYVGDAFVRLIPFKNHINIEAQTAVCHREELAGYQMTPKGMLQIDVTQKIPCDVLKRIFSETLK